jgi:hypothetical protein
VQTAARPTATRTRAVIAFAIMAGMLLGVVLFGLQKQSRARQAGHAAEATTATSATVAAAPPTPAPATTPDAEPTASAATTSSGVATGASSAGDAAAVGGRKARKLCKPAGGKCLSNADFCDQTCRKWTCRANAALADPYETGGK